MVGIYCRISGNKEEDKDTSIDLQERKGIEFAESLGLPYRVYIDRGVSGRAEIEARIQFSNFLKDITSGVISHIYAINQSRIERNPDTWRLFVATVINAGAKWYPNGVYYKLADRTNKLLADMLSLINEFHSGNTSDAVKLAFMQNAEQGKGHGLKAYGIDYDSKGFMVKNEEEMEVVKRIFDLSLSGMGVYSIANLLNDEGIPTRYGKMGKTTSTTEKNTGRVAKHSNKKWWGSTVSGILKKRLYYGIHTWGGEEFFLPHLAVIDKKTYDAVQKNFKKNKKDKVGKNQKYRYLLNGLMFCSKCGSMLKGVKKVKSRDNSYKCVGKQAPLNICKGSRAVNIPKFETFILKHLFENKGLQGHLNQFDEDKDLIEILVSQKEELNKKLAAAMKSETKSFNIMFEEDFANDERVKEKYKQDKQKVENLKEIIQEVESRIQLQKDNNRLTKVNKVIDGFSIKGSFEAIHKAVLELIDRIDVEYIPLEKNGIYRFKIKYKGFNETIAFSTNQQMENFICTAYDNETEPDEFGAILVESYRPQKIFFRHKLKGLYKEQLDIQLNKQEIIDFNPLPSKLYS